MTREQLEERFQLAGEPVYRGRQLYHALYRERQFDLGKITGLPRRVRAQIAEQFEVTLPAVERTFQSADATSRYLLALADGREIETVVMPEVVGGVVGKKIHRTTVCVSTQAGCAVDCKFCLTGALGFSRNLSAGEIVGQVLRVMGRGNSAAAPRVNLVFMGMGEPFLNYDQVLAAVRLLADPEGVGISSARMTVSTAGVVPGIERLGEETIRPRLAVSLNAPNDELRTQIMPINKKWPIAELLRACRNFPLRPGEKLTFEYVLLAGVNDSLAHARQLAKLVRPINCKVNLIGWNPGPDLDFHTPAEALVLEFQRELKQRGVPAYLRKPRGRDIFAACGQLKLAGQESCL